MYRPIPTPNAGGDCAPALAATSSSFNFAGLRRNVDRATSQSAAPRGPQLRRCALAVRGMMSPWGVATSCSLLFTAKAGGAEGLS